MELDGAPPDAGGFSAAANHYLQSDTGNHHHQQPNTDFSATGFVPAAAINHHHTNTDFLAAAAARIQLNCTAVHTSPRYTDSQLESEFSGLSLMPAVRPPALVAPPPNYNVGSSSFTGHNNSIFNDSNGNGGVSFPQRGDIDLRVRNRRALCERVMRRVKRALADMPYNSRRNRRNNMNHHPQSSLHRIQKNWRPSELARLSSLKGKILSVARDAHGSRFLEGKLEEGKAEEIEMIFMELKDHTCDLMADEFGKYVVKRLLEACNHHQITQLLMPLITDDQGFMHICSMPHGSIYVQRLLDIVTTTAAAEQRSGVISVLRRTTLGLAKDAMGHLVFLHCLKLFSFEDKKVMSDVTLNTFMQHIVEVVADHCMEIATDMYGWHVLKQCVVEHAVGELRDRLISEITSNALMLSQHPKGHNVVQYILVQRIAQATAGIIVQLSGNFVPLSMHPYGSRVIRRFFIDPKLEESQLVPIIEEIIYSPHFLMVLQHPQGSDIAQNMFSASKGTVRSAMISLIQANEPHLHSHPHGMRVLQCIKGNSLPSL